MVDQVIIGVGPHKLSATIEVVDGWERLLGSGRFTTDRAGCAAMLTYVESSPHRLWAVKGSNGAGRPLGLAARVRLFDSGQNRKTDARDADSIAMVAVRSSGLRVLAEDTELDAPRMLSDRRGADQTTGPDRHRLLAELLPGQAEKDTTSAVAKKAKSLAVAAS